MNMLIIGFVLAFAGSIYAYDELGCHHGSCFYDYGTITTFGGCHWFYCVNGRWEIVPFSWEYPEPQDCDMCRGYDDPHMMTFDHIYQTFEMQKVCQQVMTQLLVDPSYSTPQVPFDPLILFGVATDFEYCWLPSSSVSCVGTTTFKNNMHTSLRFDHKAVPITWEILGGESGTIDTLEYDVAKNVKHPLDLESPILMWRVDYALYPGGYSHTCIKAQGEHLSVMACRYAVNIWAKTYLYKRLGGHCGNYTGDPVDDGQASNGTTFSIHESDLHQSWRTADQLRLECVCGGNTCQEREITKDEVEKECRYKADYVRKCTKLANQGEQLKDSKEYRSFINGCVIDLCEAEGTKIDMWETEEEIAAVANGNTNWGN